MKPYIKINIADNVAVALADLPKGTEIDGVVTIDPIPRGHKAAIRPIKAGEAVVKYGFPIGKAKTPILPGQWVHTHNLGTALADNLKYRYEPTAMQHPREECCDFEGYVRRNGDVGIRNELWIIPTVGCVNSQAKAIAESIKAESMPEGVDDVCAFTHSYGCSQLGEDHANTRNALAALATHPNAGGVLILGLGCENNQIAALREQMGEYDPERVRFLVAQETEDEIADGCGLCRQLIERMRSDKREKVPVSKLKIGVKCGGSDGLSGITANPLVGLLTDRITACGGTAVLTEVPEMFGAETLLMNRAASREVFDSTVSLINGFKQYFRSYGQPIYENPSPGNKAGGITTLEEKSLGCVQKGGKAAVTGVLQYAQKATAPGLNLLNAPGNDLVASTALALSGCQMVLFTTGRGTPFGTFVPTMKISTNTPLALKKHHWIDFNAGILIEGADPHKTLDLLWQKVIDTASGAPLRHEALPAKEIAIFKSGVTL